MDDMAWAVFSQECHMGSAPGRPGYGASPSPEPQQFPRVFIDHAVAAGAAVEVQPPNKANAPADAGIIKRTRRNNNGRA